MSEKDAEELLQGSKEQKRHNTEPSSSNDGEETPNTEAAIQEAFEAIDKGETPSNITVRDTNLAALLRGLETSGELEELAADVRMELDRDGESVSRSQTLGDLARVGLQVVAPETVEIARNARENYILSQEDSF